MVRIRVHNPLIDDDNERLVLSHCRELCELEFRSLGSNDTELDVISSIESRKIEKIIFANTNAFGHLVDNAFWTRLDDILIELVGRLDCKLEVEFRDAKLGTKGWFNKKAPLPKFVEEGRVIVSDELGDLVYCSDEEIVNTGPASGMAQRDTHNFLATCKIATLDFS